MNTKQFCVRTEYFVCEQQGMYPLQTYRKFMYAYQIFCMHTHVWACTGVLFAYNMFYMLPKVLYVYKIVCTRTICFVRVQ